MWKLELQQTVHLPGEQLSSVAHNCLLYTLPCCCHEAKNTYSVPSAFLQDLIPIPGSLLAQRICCLGPKVKASFLVSIPLLSAKWQLAFPNVLGLKKRAPHSIPVWPTEAGPARFAVGAVLPPLSHISFVDLTRQWLICPLQWVWLTFHYLSPLKMLFDLGSKSSLCRAFFSSGKKNEMQNKGVSSPELIAICQGLVGVWVCLRFCSLPVA